MLGEHAGVTVSHELGQDQRIASRSSASTGNRRSRSKRIREDVLQNQRAEYGKEIVDALSRQLTAEFASVGR